jgi:uncharacterized protein YjiK
MPTPSWQVEVDLHVQRITATGKLLREQPLDLHQQREALIYLGDEASALAKLIERKLAPWNQ